MLKPINYKNFDLNKFLQKRAEIPLSLENNVKSILKNVQKNGDKSIFEYTKLFDNTDFKKTGLKTGGSDIKAAYFKILKNDPLYIKTVKKIIKRIYSFHKKQIEKNWINRKNKNEFTGQIINPIEKVMIYIPGGNAYYPSSIIMNVIPAQCAGVKNIFLTTPVKNNQPLKDEILSVLYLLGIDEIYHIGGVQAIAAFTYGTKSIPKVYKICGPGNIYVTIAKKLVYGTIDIDMIAGPSEVLIIADKTSNPKYIALDMLAQAEHDIMARSILLSTSSDLIKKTGMQIHALLKVYKSETAEKSLMANGKAIKVNNIEQAFNLANEIAPEHLEIHLQNPIKYLKYIKNAGSVFLGEYTPESVGDYFAGPNHTLPTMGTAKFFSQLGVYDFVKRTGFSYFSKKKLNDSKKYICKIAEIEKLKFHSLSVKLR